MDKRWITPALVADFERRLIYEERSAATREKYLRDVRRYAAFLAGREAGAEATRDFKEDLRARGYAPGSINSMLASLNALFKFAGWTDCAARRVRTQKAAYCPEERELTRAEYYRLLRAAKSDRARLLMETIGSTGIRVSELRFFTVEAVRAGAVTVTCKNKTRTVFLPRQLRQMLASYAKERGIVSGPVFLGRDGRPVDRRSVWAVMKRVAARAGVALTKVFPHNLRKLFARLFYAAAHDVVKLADVLGHSSIDTTRIYLMTSGAEHRALMENLGLVFRPMRA